MRGFFFIYPMKIIGVHKSINWNRQPLVRPLMLIIAGLLCSQFVIQNILVINICILVLTSALLVHSHKRFLNQALVSFIINSAFFLSGISLAESSICSDVGIPKFSNSTLLVKQRTEPVYKGFGDDFKSQCIVEAKAILVGNTWKDIDGNIKITLIKDSLTTLPGELLLLHGHFKKPSNEILPGSFDFERFCRIKSIDALCTINKNQLMPLGKNEQNFVFSFILKIRRAIISYLKDSGFDANQVGIASALLVGYRADIDAELNSAYSKAGIVHVLAVSGMHVSLVFGSVLWLLGRFLKPRNAVVAGIFVLWFYAFLAGLSSSVLRSACMFSLLAISKLLVKSSITSNAMAGAALLMLISDPQILYDPGAQLSFAAVWGIYARSTTPSILFFKCKLVRYVIDSLWICMVAQLATLPITLWYFGSFPVYFLLANLLAVPFSTGLIYLGFISLILFPLGFVSVPLLELMKVGIDVLNYFTLFVSSLPLSSIDFGRLAFIDVLFAGCVVYTILFPTGSVLKKVYAIGFARIIYALIIILYNSRSDKGPDLYFFSCEQTYHFVYEKNSSLRLINIGTEQSHTCNRTNRIIQYAQAEGHNVEIENHTEHNTEFGGNVCIKYVLDGRIKTLALQINPSETLVNWASTDKFSPIYCRQLKFGQKAQFIYTTLFRRRVLPIGILNSYKIR